MYRVFGLMHGPSGLGFTKFIIFFMPTHASCLLMTHSEAGEKFYLENESQIWISTHEAGLSDRIMQACFIGKQLFLLKFTKILTGAKIKCVVVVTQVG